MHLLSKCDTHLYNECNPHHIVLFIWHKPLSKCVHLDYYLANRYRSEIKFTGHEGYYD